MSNFNWTDSASEHYLVSKIFYDYLFKRLGNLEGLLVINKIYKEGVGHDGPSFGL